MAYDQDLRKAETLGSGGEIGAEHAGARFSSQVKKIARRRVILIIGGAALSAGVVYLFVMVFHKPIALVFAGMVLAHLLMHSGGHDHGGGHGNQGSADGTEDSAANPPERHH